MTTKQPLSNLKVIDLTQVAAGPYAASLLGDFGADVVKIEPIGGEPFRRIDSIFGENESAYFHCVNRSKRSVSIDLKKSEGLDLLRALVEKADVVLIAMRPAAIQKLKLTYEDLCTANPELVYCSITAFGESGPRQTQPGIDILVQGIAGIMGTTGEPDGPPIKVGPPVTDFATSFLACFSIMVALEERRRSGKGQKIELSLLNSAVAVMANYVTQYMKTGKPVIPQGGGHPQMAPYQSFRTRDEKWIIVACLTEKFWSNFCTALVMPELIKDPRFLTNALRLDNRQALNEILNKAMVARDAAEWEDSLIRHDVPCARVNSVGDMMLDPQIVHNECIAQFDSEHFGRLHVANNPIRMSRTPPLLNRPPAPLGTHTEEVLEELGWTEKQITRAFEEGVVA